MFTGLIEEVGVITRAKRESEGTSFTIRAEKVLDGTTVGDSIAVSGACLTVTAIGSREFTAYCMPETLKRTTLGKSGAGTKVNLERSLALGDRVGGHLVLGHVDARVLVSGVQRKGQALVVDFSLCAEVAPYVAEKGSVTLDGVSLTVVEAGTDHFSVGLIPHSMASTTLGSLRAGDEVNLEADVLARYVRRSLQTSGEAADTPDGEEGELSMELLREKGFA